MIRFVDGPAGGTNLSLQRAPYFLRVVIDKVGNVDALDQLDDGPRPGEVLHVYRLMENPTTIIACTRGKGGGCRHIMRATYAIYGEQPPQETLANNDAWRNWAEGQRSLVDAEKMS